MCSPRGHHSHNDDAAVQHIGNRLAGDHTLPDQLSVDPLGRFTPRSMKRVL
jgi:hypothetical protein